jgi:hypothetical protein
MQERQILTCRSVSVLAVPATYRPMSASDRWASSGMSGFRTILPLGLSLNAVVSDGTPTFLKSHAVSAEQVPLIPQCAECGEVWLPADEERWSYLDTDSVLVFYRPEWAEREFGEWRWRE